MTQDTIDLFGHWGLGHKAETESGADHTQGGLGGVHGADILFLHAGCPLLKNIVHIIMKGNLRLSLQVLIE